MKLLRLIFLILISIFLSINNDAKSIKDQEMGTVSILISSNTFLLDSELEKDFVKIPENSDQPPFKVLIKGNGSIKEIPLQERQKKINDYGKEFFVDEYQIKVPIGFYVIEVEGITIYQFPKFLVDKNEVVRFDKFFRFRHGCVQFFAVFLCLINSCQLAVSSVKHCQFRICVNCLG